MFVNFIIINYKYENEQRFLIWFIIKFLLRRYSDTKRAIFIQNKSWALFYVKSEK